MPHLAVFPFDFGAFVGISSRRNKHDREPSTWTVAGDTGKIQKGIGVMRLPVILLALVTPGCTNASEPTGLFADLDQALEFTASLGPEWRDHTADDFGTPDYLGYAKPTFFIYRLGERKGYAGIAYSPDGKIALYEVRYPSADGHCIDVPQTHKLAENVIREFEPSYTTNIREINRVKFSADFVWPHQSLPSGPGALVGNTVFRFYKMGQHCSFRVFRVLDSLEDKPKR